MKRLVLAVLSLIALQSSALAAVPSIEQEALVSLYNTTNGSDWWRVGNWLVGDPCDDSWYGVTCDASSNIIEIKLGWNNLEGTIPAELGNLANLENLDFLGDQLSGPIPVELSNLVSLTSLNLAGNELSGKIPAELGSLVNLVNLDLFGNELSGSIPAELGNLASLTSLRLAENKLSGAIPLELGNLVNLENLDLHRNQLNGPIPVDLGNLANLRVLWLFRNQLSGPIPAELGNLVSLTNLWLDGNQLNGPIPAELGNLANLEILYLGNNQLNGPIPDEYGNLASLTSLRLAVNQLSGPIPAELGNLANLQVLYLGNNQLSGTIPVELGNLASLEGLGLEDNQLSGTIPAELGNLASLHRMRLDSNQLSGAIPASFQYLSGFIDDDIFVFFPFDLGINFNALFTSDPALHEFLDEITYDDWSSSQTIEPTNVLIGNTGPDSVSLSWDPIEYQQDGRYIVSMSTAVQDPYVYVGETTSKMDTDYQVEGLAYGRYYFVVQSQTDPHSANANTVTSGTSMYVKTVVNGLEGGWIDSRPKTFRASNGTFSDRVELTWDAVGGAIVYRVYRCKAIDRTSCGSPVGYAKGASFNDTKAIPGREYYYRVRACIAATCGKFSATNTGFIGIAPDAPTGVTASDGTYINRVEVTWSTVDNATTYRIFRCLDNGDSCGAPIGFRNTPVFNDLKSTPEQVYYYRIRACTTTCSDLSAADTGHIAKQLDKPTGIRATDGAYPERVHVSWDGEDGTSVYRVFRCPDTSPNCGSPIGFPKDTSFNDTKGDPGVVYYYRIKACTTRHCSKFSVLNAGHRGSTPMLQNEPGHEVSLADPDVPIPALSTWGRLVLILITLVLGLLLISYRGSEGPRRAKPMTAFYGDLR